LEEGSGGPDIIEEKPIPDETLIEAPTEEGAEILYSGEVGTKKFAKNKTAKNLS
jgi:hypothetical protein